MKMSSKLKMKLKKFKTKLKKTGMKMKDEARDELEGAFAAISKSLLSSLY